MRHRCFALSPARSSEVEASKRTWARHARVYNAAGGDAPPGIAALGPDVWCGDLPPARRGFVALGVPIGHPVFVGAHAAGRLEAEADLLHKLQRLPDLQSAWLLLAYCAAPRAQHLLRNVPPADLLPYARAHDAAIWNVVEGLLGGQGPDEGDAWLAARAVAFLPPSFGGLGLLSAERVSSAAYGPRGRTRCRSSAHATPKSLTGWCMSSRASRRGLACEQQHLPRTGSLRQAGKLDRIGTLVPVAQADRPSTEKSGSGTPVGRDTPFSHSTFPFENACCYQP